MGVKSSGKGMGEEGEEGDDGGVDCVDIAMRRGLGGSRGSRDCKKRPGVVFFHNELQAWTN